MSTQHTHCSKNKTDYFFWGPLLIVALSYMLSLFFHDKLDGILKTFVHTHFELMNEMWIGLVLGIIFVGILGLIPRDIATAALSSDHKIKGILKATIGGLLFDLCSHGILLVGMKFYERGAKLGQVMAFLIASPWNSISLTIILISLIGWFWTLTFIALSAVIAIISGFIFETLVEKNILPKNPYETKIEDDFKVWEESKIRLKKFKLTTSIILQIIKDGFRDSKMILKWIFIGIILASILRILLTPELFKEFLGPSLLGLSLTLVLATVLEVCSEGSVPIASDILRLGKAPGNGFAFLMAGVSTDYTEVMSIKEHMKSWKIALFLPLVTLPQILILAYLINRFIIE